MTNNYYEILGVSRTASSAQIKAAFYTLSKKYHPDINPKTANLFRNMNEAYQTLKDSNKRKKYDELLDLGIEENSNEANIFTESFKDTYYTNPEYYQDPTKEPIVNILDDFWKYRFENATSAIWNRNVFILITNVFLCFAVFIMILVNRTIKSFNKKGIDLKKQNNIWLNYINEAIEENKLGRYACWTGFMFTLATGKLVYHTFNIIYWIFAKIVKYFLLPVAIIIATLLHIYIPHRYRY